jgi:redox-sensitive bicupin YhaK (pirin superfamily)
MLDLVISARRKDLGGGLEVGRVLPFARHRMVGPFIFLDHMGPADFAPGHGVDVRPHPHIGLATVTYLFDGEILHRDSLGSAEAIRPGEVNWMTAGRGIVHSERSDSSLRARGSRLHGMQSWVALPNESEESAPSFTHYGATSLLEFAENGARGRLIAGTAYGLKSSVATFSPIFYVHLDLAPGARIGLPPDHDERGAYIVSGRVESGGAVYEPGHLLVFGRGDATLAAVEGPARLMLLGGASVGPRYIWWNFVSSSLDRMEAAKAEWRAGRMKLPPGDNQEFIPLPDEPLPHPTDPV